MELDQQTVAALKTGIAWLAETQQPPGSLPSHLGECFFGHRKIGFSPGGRATIGRKGIVVVVQIIHPVWSLLATLENPFAPGEVDAYANTISSLGHQIVDRWNGTPNSESACFRIDLQAHPSYVAGVDLYHAGCPKHRTKYCAHNGGCTWWHEGYAKVIKPVWPTPVAVGSPPD